MTGGAGGADGANGAIVTEGGSSRTKISITPAGLLAELFCERFCGVSLISV